MLPHRSPLTHQKSQIPYRVTSLGLSSGSGWTSRSVSQVSLATEELDRSSSPDISPDTSPSRTCTPTPNGDGLPLALVGSDEESDSHATLEKHVWNREELIDVADTTAALVPETSDALESPTEDSILISHHQVDIVTPSFKIDSYPSSPAAVAQTLTLETEAVYLCDTDSRPPSPVAVAQTVVPEAGSVPWSDTDSSPPSPVPAAQTLTSEAEIVESDVPSRLASPKPALVDKEMPFSELVSAEADVHPQLSDLASSEHLPSPISDQPLPLQDEDLQSTPPIEPLLQEAPSPSPPPSPPTKPSPRADSPPPEAPLAYSCEVTSREDSSEAAPLTPTHSSLRSDSPPRDASPEDSCEVAVPEDSREAVFPGSSSEASPHKDSFEAFSGEDPSAPGTHEDILGTIPRESSSESISHESSLETVPVENFTGTAPHEEVSEAGPRDEETTEAAPRDEDDSEAAPREEDNVETTPDEEDNFETAPHEDTSELALREDLSEAGSSEKFSEKATGEVSSEAIPPGDSSEAAAQEAPCEAGTPPSEDLVVALEISQPPSPSMAQMEPSTDRAPMPSAAPTATAASTASVSPHMAQSTVTAGAMPPHTASTSIPCGVARGQTIPACPVGPAVQEISQPPSTSMTQMEQSIDCPPLPSATPTASRTAATPVSSLVAQPTATASAMSQPAEATPTARREAADNGACRTSHAGQAAQPTGIDTRTTSTSVASRPPTPSPLETSILPRSSMRAASPTPLSPLDPISPWPPRDVPDDKDNGSAPHFPKSAQSDLPSAKEVYGSLAVLLTYLAFGTYLFWGFAPIGFLDRIGWTWYPSREWALIIPCWLMLVVLLTYFSYAGLTLFLTPGLSSINLITDDYSSPRTLAMAPNPYYWKFVDPQAVPEAIDLPLDVVNAVLYPRRGVNSGDNAEEGALH